MTGWNFSADDDYSYSPVGTISHMVLCWSTLVKTTKFVSGKQGPGSLQHWQNQARLDNNLIVIGFSSGHERTSNSGGIFT